MTSLEESFRKVKEELENLDNNAAWTSFFQSIKNESSNHDFTCGEAKNPSNKHLNRYRDVSPYDHSRVILKNGNCSYINASLLKVPKAGRNYILTQGALEITAGHFWLMVWEQKSKAILMLNKVIEKNQPKCYHYWPVGSKRGKSDIMDFTDVNLRVHLLAEDESHHFVIRTLRIEEVGTDNFRDVWQFHYTTWPDFGVPSTARTFLHFLQAVRDKGALNNNVGPPVVHCSAGIGRSGTFCLVDTCLLMMEQGVPLDIKQILLDMRKYRMGLIQTADQLRFSYLAILEGLQQLVDGNTRFLEDNEEPWTPPDIIPRPPPRITSLTATQGQFEEFIRNQNLIDNVRGVADKPLPELPSSSDSEEESSEDEILDDPEEEEEESVSYGLFEGVKDNTPSESISELSTKAENSSTNSKRVSRENSVDHERSNGVDEAAVRRRLKNETMIEKIREIKTKQKETERSPEPKRRKRSEDGVGKNK